MGYALLAGSVYLIGGNASKDEQLIQSFSGLVLLGMSAALISSPMFPELIESIEAVDELE